MDRRNGKAVGWWLLAALLASPCVFAQGGGTTTFSVSTDRVTLFESPPACGPIGSARVVTSPPVVTNTIGPACIGIGDQRLSITNPNPNPACGGSPPAPPPIDPFHGQTFQVAAGDNNIDVYTLVQTFQCVAAVTGVPTAVPALPWSGLVALALLVALAGGWYVWQRAAVASHGGDTT